jgi:sulfofructose kinase
MVCDVLAIGVCTVDLIVRVPTFPQVDGRMEVLDLTQAIGGNAAVAAAALGRLGAHVGFAGVVGNDARGHMVRTGLREAGVDLVFLNTVEGIQTVTTIIISDVSTGTRTILTPPAKPTAPPSEALRRAAESAQYVHLDHAALPPLAAELLPRCRAAGTRVSFDGGVAVPRLETYLPLIDVFVATRRALHALTGEHDLAQALARARDAGPRTVAVTMGEEGSAGLAEDGSLVVAPAFRVDVADSTGAGDVFHGAFLFALLQGQGMRDALAFANAAAALSCRAIGGHPGCPTLEQVQALLHARGGGHG